MCVWHWKFYFNWCTRLRYLWILTKSLEKRDNLQFKNALCLEVYVYLNLIYIWHFWTAKSFLYIIKFCKQVMCNCGAVVECRASNLKESGSRPSCVIAVFKRWWAVPGKLSLLRITIYMHKFPCSGSVNLDKVGHIFTHFWMLYAISA